MCVNEGLEKDMDDLVAQLSTAENENSKLGEC